ncbi:hypothetical protein AC1031_015033 [Aphanomyces cochlioides]|nr:hypothetical protein AC1031_015033 [Aphanomyces cochlioides]
MMKIGENQLKYSTFDGTPEAQHLGPKHHRIRLLIATVAFFCTLCFPCAVLVVHHKSYSNFLSLVRVTPAIKLTMKFKRRSMYYFGQSFAQLYVFPRQNKNTGSLVYDGVVELQHDTVTEKYIYVDSRAYYTKKVGNSTSVASCLAASQMPLLHSLDSTLHSARVVESAEVGTRKIEVKTDCPGGRLLSVVFGGEKFILCSSNAERISHAIGEDMDIDVEYLTSRAGVPNLEVPTAEGGSTLQCDIITPEDVPITSSLAAAITEFTKSLLGSRPKDFFGTDCKCKSVRKPCLFIHGLFNFIEAPMTDSFSLYWGNVHKHLPCCSSTKFVHFDTINHGWNDDSIQHSFCKAALQVSASKNKTIGPLNLITHSMGNMIAGAALATGKCTMSNKVTWISSAGPMRGSQGANLLAQKCLGGGLDAIITKPLKFLGFCPPTRAFASLYYQTTMNQATQKLLIASQQARAKHTNKKVLCGTSGYGITSIFSVPLQIIGAWVDHKDANDGMVSVESCTAGLSSSVIFGGDITSKNYKGPMNHEDLAFRNGDGWLGDNRKPVKWLSCAL